MQRDVEEETKGDQYAQQEDNTKEGHVGKIQELCLFQLKIKGTHFKTLSRSRKAKENCKS